MVIDPDVDPKFFNYAYTAVLFSAMKSIQHELDKMEDMGILERVSTSESASLILPVPKCDGNICICSDTISSCLQVDNSELKIFSSR